jgi:NADPH:quinone reductase-like Zn-dependent oxidoreductase
MAETASVPLPVSALFRRDARVLGFVLSNASVSDLAAAAALINKRLAAGGLQAPIAYTMTLADTVEAHRLIEEGPARGRIVLHP